MKRIEFLMQGLELNEIQATLISELISDMPNNQLKNFLVFRMQFIEPYKSKELITKEALFEYRKIQTENRLRQNEKVFSTLDEMKTFIQLHYKGKELGYGLGDYFDYVVIALDKEGNLVRKNQVTAGGNYPKIDGENTAKIYKFLFENQHRIGLVKYITQQEVTQIEHKKEEPQQITSTRVKKLTSKIIKKF